jgi:hypothetical protein
MFGDNLDSIRFSAGGGRAQGSPISVEYGRTGLERLGRRSEW